MKKVAHIQILPILSGGQRVILDILDCLPDNEYEKYVITRSGGPLVQKVTQKGYHHIAANFLFRKFSPCDLLAFFQLIYIYKKYKFDIVHTHASKTGILGRVAAKLAGVPTIYHTVHGFSFHPYQNKFLHLFYQLAEKIVAKFSDKIVFVNNYERQLAIRKNLVSKQQAITIYNGVEQVTNLQSNKPDDLKGFFVVGSTLRFEPQKNIIDTMKVAILTAKLNSDLKFVFVGEGSLLHKARQLVRKNRLEHRIIFPGWQDDISSWLRSFDAFLLYSKWEGLPLSILEAMSYGLPIIASDIKGNNELVDNRNGILVSVNQIDKLVQVLRNLPDNKNLKRWREGSIYKVKNNFSKSKFARKYRELYNGA
ncbi:MAG: glycosyltransferase family 4 protein [Candidatus Cloacimonadota bacterium]|nr:glycosyltransferase family 4 protein [Candidatus Cloacimonadota bacterium]